MHPRRHILLAAALTTLAASVTWACPQHERHAAGARFTLAAAPQAVSEARVAALVAWKPRAWTPRGASGAAQGLRIAIDPVDGARGMPAPDAMEQVVIGDGVPIPDDAPVPIVRASDGTITAHLDARWADFAVATIGRDGKPTWSCVQGQKAAAQFLRNPAPVQAVQREVK